jgi:oxygen-independent coproporphyrinogen-3 oxidase
MKYWHREPYLGFGLDAHSMLQCTGSSFEALRWANTDVLDAYMEQDKLVGAPKVVPVTCEQAFEEALFLGLRLNEGLDLNDLRAQFGEDLLQNAQTALVEVTARGRLASNEVFSRLLVG